MTERIDRIRPVPERRMWVRRDEDRGATFEDIAPAEPEPEAPTPAVITEAAEGPPETPDPRERNGFVAFVAQVLGQPGQKRGLRGGPETLEKARSAYLEAEYSGPADRRIPPGKIGATEV